MEGRSLNLQQKHHRMIDLLRGLNKVIVAFSAGVDSTVVLKVALDTLGVQNVLAATGVSPSLAQRELNSVQDLANLLHAPLELVNTSEMDSPQYAANPSNRCYFCKSELYTKLNQLAQQRGYEAVLNGVNADDIGQWRPGITAAKEYAIRSPLLEAGLTKSDTRDLARELGLPNWQKPALACLSSRVAYGTPITITSLKQIEQAESFLWEHGFTNFRVRHHPKLARIEVSPDDLPKLCQPPLRDELIAHFRQVGYTYVTVDLQGFRSGSGNEVLSQ